MQLTTGAKRDKWKRKRDFTDCKTEQYLWLSKGFFPHSVVGYKATCPYLSGAWVIFVAIVSMADYDFQHIEEKWQAHWRAAHLYRVTRNTNKPKCYVLDMFP
jgi:valyl-tRNA synthetase